VTIQILTAIGDPTAEAELAATLATSAPDLEVVRRCVDLADLLATAAAGRARAVVLAADLRRLDREAISRLGFAGVAVVGLAASPDDSAAQRLRQLGVERVVTADGVAVAVRLAVDAFTAGVTASQAPQAQEPPQGLGRVIAVWGPAGAPGRTTVAVNLAAELARLGRPVLLVDADTYGGAVAQLLGVLDEAPGLAAACRFANAGRLDRAQLVTVAQELSPGLCVLTGIGRAERWPEIRASSFTEVLRVARDVASYVVVDAGFCLEQDEDLTYDTTAPHRNGATLAALAAADVVVAVAGADPVGLGRYLRLFPQLSELTAVAPVTVVNRVRERVLGPGDPGRQATSALVRYAGIEAPVVVPDDPAAVDGATAVGRTLAEQAAKSAVRLAIRGLALRIAEGTYRAPGEPPTGHAPRRDRRRGAASGLRRTSGRGGSRRSRRRRRESESPGR